MSNILSQNKLLTALGLTGCAFVGYAFYFDYKRTHAPDYKDKLRAKRKAAQKAKQPSAIPGKAFSKSFDRSHIVHELILIFGIS